METSFDVGGPSHFETNVETPVWPFLVLPWVMYVKISVPQTHYLYHLYCIQSFYVLINLLGEKNGNFSIGVMSLGKYWTCVCMSLQTYNAPIHSCSLLQSGLYSTNSRMPLTIASLIVQMSVYITHYLHWDEQHDSEYSAWLSHTSCRKLMLARIVQPKHVFINQHCCNFMEFDINLLFLL